MNTQRIWTFQMTFNLLSQRYQNITEIVKDLKEKTGRMSLLINISKTKDLRLKNKSEEVLFIEENEVEHVEKFYYLEIVLSSRGGMDEK